MLLKRLIILTLAIFIAPCPGFAQKPPLFTVQVNSDNINVRADCTVSSEIICKADKGDRFEAVDQKYNWYRIRLPKETRVYIKQELLELSATCDPAAGADGKVRLPAKVAATNVNIRLNPSLESRIIGHADYGQAVEIIEKKEGWYAITPTDNCYGWIHGKFIQDAPEVTTPPETEEAIILEAPVLPQEEKLPEIKGSIRPYWSLFGSKGTHKLISEEGRTYILKGDQKLMDTFNQTEVVLSGEFLSDPEDKVPVFSVKSIKEIE